MDLVEARARGFAEGARHPWERARLALTLALIRRHGGLAEGDVVLDIGCGDTFVVESLARLFPRSRFHAVDSAFTPDLIALFAGRLTVPNVTLAASLDSVPRTHAASLILLMDVLEHVEDDRGMLRALAARPLVDARTRFLITVPAYQALFCSHDRFLGHYRRYSTHTLGALLAYAGLVPLESGNLFTTLVPMRLLQVLRERVAPPPDHAPSATATWQGGDLAGRLITRALEWDGHLSLALLRLGLRLPGLSNFAVCRTSA